MADTNDYQYLKFGSTISCLCTNSSTVWSVIAPSSARSQIQRRLILYYYFHFFSVSLTLVSRNSHCLHIRLIENENDRNPINSGIVLPFVLIMICQLNERRKKGNIFVCSIDCWFVGVFLFIYLMRSDPNMCQKLKMHNEHRELWMLNVYVHCSTYLYVWRVNYEEEGTYLWNVPWIVTHWIYFCVVLTVQTAVHRKYSTLFWKCNTLRLNFT